jgi:hypothetical protein
VLGHVHDDEVGGAAELDEAAIVVLAVPWQYLLGQFCPVK